MPHRIEHSSVNRELDMLNAFHRHKPSAGLGVMARGEFVPDKVIIAWETKDGRASGRGTKSLDVNFANELVTDLNNKYPTLRHWTEPESQPVECLGNGECIDGHICE